jgi:hypothetical protein
MNRSLRRAIVTVALAFSASIFFYSPAWAGGGKQTLTGEVSDAMCGRKHMEDPAADCTRTCVQHGSKYSLVVGDKIYILETSDKAALALLDTQAGKKATVTGSVNGDSIEVSSVVAAK